jgi:ubiquinol oxidase
MQITDDLPTMPTQFTPLQPQPGDRGDWVLFHPVYTPDELKAVRVLRHEPQNIQDRAAAFLVKALRCVVETNSNLAHPIFLIHRKGFDFLSGYRHKPIPAGNTMTLAELRKAGYILTESQWMTRILFLETIAGVPGFFAAMVRHLRGLRGMVRSLYSLRPS